MFFRLLYYMNNIYLGENQITLFYVWVKKVIWAKACTAYILHNNFYHIYIQDPIQTL